MAAHPEIARHNVGGVEGRQGGEGNRRHSSFIEMVLFLPWDGNGDVDIHVPGLLNLHETFRIVTGSLHELCMKLAGN